jgi:hypothetical protein
MRILALALLGGLVVAASAPGQTPAGAKAPAYDTQAEVTLTGIVQDSHVSRAAADHPGLHVRLAVGTEAAAETVEVHTCPVRFLSNLDFAVAKGDRLTVIGSRPGGGGVVVARELTKGQISLTLRDKAGKPVW